jgi:lipopolysaccharide transport system permease protein
MNRLFKSLWGYRGFIIGSAQREFQLKYSNSLLGGVWAVLNPLAMIIVYTVIFSQVMHSKLPNIDNDFAYSIYLCSGILTWGLFSEIVSRAQTTFLEHANLLKKLSFPRLCLPIIVVINALLNFSIIFSLFSVFLLMSDNFPGLVFLALIPVFIVLIAFSIGLGISLGVLNVFFRDVGQFFGIFIQFWFWLTPIVYPVSILPESVRLMMVYNPMYSIINACQEILVNQHWPVWQDLLPVTFIALVLCLFAMRLFRNHASEIVDEL